MAGQIAADCFKKELMDLLGETFEEVQGIFLNRGTSLFETIDSISAEKASKPISDQGSGIAAQIDHIEYYLRVLGGSIKKKNIGTPDWEKSWEISAVTPEEWDTLRSNLKETYQNLLLEIQNLDLWEGEDDIGASLGILAHTACHLGAIRQALHIIR